MEEPQYHIPVCQLSGAVIARLRASADTTIGDLTTALCKKAGIEDGLLALAFEGTVLERDISVGIAELNNETVLTAVRYPEVFVTALFDDGSLKIWSESGHCEKFFEPRRGAMLSAAFTTSGLGVATGSMDANAYLWNVTNGRCERYYQGHKGGISCIATSMCGTMIATGSFDRTVILWDLASGTMLSRTPGSRGSIMSMAFSKSGLLCTGSEDNAARLWEVIDGQLEQLGETLHGHEGAVVSVAFSPDGVNVATGSADGTARIWNMKGKCKISFQVAQTPKHGNLGVAAGSPCVRAVSWSPNGELLATGCSDGLVRIWHARSGRCDRSFWGNPQQVAGVRTVHFSPAGLGLVTGTDDGVVALWDIGLGQEKIVLDWGGHGGGVRSVSFTPGPLAAAEPESRSTSKASRSWSKGSRNRSKDFR